MPPSPRPRHLPSSSAGATGDAPRRFDSPTAVLLARLDAMELELLVKLDALAAIEVPSAGTATPAAKLGLGEILRLVLTTAFVAINYTLALAWLWGL